MLRKQNFTREQLLDAWNILTNISDQRKLPQDILTNAQQQLFGKGDQEFLGQLGRNITPHPNRLPTDNPVFIDDVGRMYYPHALSDASEPQTVGTPCLFPDVWFVKVPIGEVLKYRHPAMAAPYIDDSALLMPGPGDTLWLFSPHKDTQFPVEVYERLERRDATAMIRLTEVIPSYKDGVVDMRFFLQSVNKLI